MHKSTSLQYWFQYLKNKNKIKKIWGRLHTDMEISKIYYFKSMIWDNLIIFTVFINVGQ